MNVLREDGENLLPVEAWRGWAAFMVLVAHWGPVLEWRHAGATFAFTGVDVFFVISGFVFAPVLLGRRPVALGAYALRRLMRIYPAYLVALAVYMALMAAQGRPLLYVPEHLLMAHVQTREMAFYYAPPLWSLPSEVEFYALVPLLGLGLARAPALAWPALLLAALALRLGLLPMADGAAQNMAYILLHHLPGLLVEFLFGVWAWQRHQTEWTASRRWRWAVAGFVGALLCVAVYRALETGPRGHDWRHGQMGLALAASFALVLAATAGVAVRGVTAAACRWAGRMSYGVYLLHMAWLLPLTTWVARYGTLWGGLMAATGLLISVWLLHRLVEDPARRWARARSRRLGA